MAKKHNDNAFRAQLQVKRKENALITGTYKAYMLMALYTLHVDNGYGTVRLERFLKNFNERLAYYNGDYYNMQDIADTLFEETGIKIE